MRITQHGVHPAWGCFLAGNYREIMERETGIEPATNGLGSRDSTTELLPLSSFG